MTTRIETTSDTEQAIELAPSYRIPLFLLLVAIPLAFFNIVIAIVLSVLGLFLLFQTVNIRLQFTPTALDLYNSGSKIRSFPYSEWSNWRIFWQPVPILFYFREVKSIHFLPILFNPKTLVSCLEKYCPRV